MKIATTYKGRMRFSNDGAVPTVMDGTKEGGGLGAAPTPKETVLHGLAGCTGLDVVAILGKKKVAFDDLTIEVEAEQTQYHPKVFSAIRITYRLIGNPDDRPKIERAIELSRENFCGVSTMLKKTAKIEYVLEITPKEG